MPSHFYVVAVINDGEEEMYWGMYGWSNDNSTLRYFPKPPEQLPSFVIDDSMGLSESDSIKLEVRQV